MNAMPKVTVAPDRVSVRPGESVSVEVTIQNTGQSVEHYGAAVVGLPRDDLFDCEPSVVKLRPGESGPVQVNINIPEKPAPDAGLYTLGVLVRSPYQRQVSRCEELRMDVQPASALSVEAQPDVVVGGPDATYTLRIANEGNTVVAVTLGGTDAEQKVAYSFRPRSVQIAPNSSAPATLTARARAPWTGQEARRTLTIRASASAELSAEKAVTFVQKPRVPGGPMRVVGIAGAVAVLAGAIIAGALVSKSHQQNNPPQQQQQPTALQLPAPVPGVSTAVVKQPDAAPPSQPAGGGANGGNAGGGNGGKQGGPSAAAGPKNPTLVDFVNPPDGQVRDRFIANDLYAPSGVKLSTVTELATPNCQTATGVALRIQPAPVGAFLTSSSSTRIDSCNNLPVKMTFAAPVKQVNLVFVPLRAGDSPAPVPYSMRAQLADGSLIDITAAGTPKKLATMPYTAPPNAPILFVSFGPGVSADPKDVIFTAIRQVAYTPA
jgi:hypothetical protein